MLCLDYATNHYKRYVDMNRQSILFNLVFADLIYKNSNYFCCYYCSGETVDKLYSPSKAVDVRDALAKALYSRMFHWLVSRINNYIAPQNDGNYTGIG